MTRPSAATLPPTGLSGIERAWSRLVTAPDSTGVERSWHVFDTHHEPTSADARLTLLCVHGNPSWSYLFRDLFARAPADVRVVAVDHLDMGFSERTSVVRRLATRVDDLGRVSHALGIDGPVVTVAHDWGGPISLGWALAHRRQLRGIVLMNTAVHQPPGSPAPALIRLVRSRPLLRPVTTSTTAFIRGAFELSDERPDAGVRAGFLAPYLTAERRAAIADFVADIPLEPDHPSAASLDAIAAGLADLDDVPTLFVWGAADRVFSDLYLHDLERRMPHAAVHRYPSAGHFVTEDADALGVVVDWVADLDRPRSGPQDGPEATSSSLLDGLERAADSAPRLAIAEMSGASIDFARLADLVDRTATGLGSAGVHAGDRVALMIPPGIDLAVSLLACWRAGVVVVLVDAGLGRAGMSAAMAAASPDHLIGIPKALAAARVLRWPGRRISTTQMRAPLRRLLGVVVDLPSLGTRSNGPCPVAGSRDVAAVAFTSGSTGPSKGVVYDHAGLAAQRDAIAELYDITDDDRLVAAFAPFALFGPILGITSVVPDMDVTEPGTLTAVALGDAVRRVGASLVFASPAALANVARTSGDLTPDHRAAFDDVRLVLSAGAPVGVPLLRSAAALFPNAEMCTPYGMTECLPVASITLTEIESAPISGDGVCVGNPIGGVDLLIDPVDQRGRLTGEHTDRPGVLGEILVRAPHARRGYDRLWHTEHLADRLPGWHATGDIGRLDEDGRLWVGGRVEHLITTADGPIAPVRLEQRAERVDGVGRCGVVGVGPTGHQQIVVVLERVDGIDAPRVAPLQVTNEVRLAIDEPVVAVFEVPLLPVDRRHNSKIDRSAVCAWASETLARGTLRRL